MTVKQQPVVDVGMMVELYLLRCGYDGLYNKDEECSCRLGDISPGDCLDCFCAPGWLVKCDCVGTCFRKFHISRDRMARL